jgi:hypothetical protein
MERLFREAWEDLRQLRERSELRLDREGSPVLAFGDWAQAKVAAESDPTKKAKLQARVDALGG